MHFKQISGQFKSRQPKNTTGKTLRLRDKSCVQRCRVYHTTYRHCLGSPTNQDQRLLGTHEIRRTSGST